MVVTEITLTGGERIRIDGDPRGVESAILAAARGSIMELAWMIDAQTGERVGINPEHVIMLREVESSS
ncbi:MAG TPA: hypothetical protein VGF68_05815 [Solirubrobacteraceae bacterium]|jgi:hypothetical protein